MTTCTDGSVRFGKPGCTNPEICIPAFKPICTFDEPRATEAMTLEAPHPRIVLPLPPSDCACFLFEQKLDGQVRIKPKTDPTDPKFRVEIKQAGTDCCTGMYEITPSIEIPECTLSDEVKNGTCKLGGLGGTLRWTLKRVNCELQLEMSGNINAPTMPQCFPTFNLNTTNVRITYKENASDTRVKETAGSFTVTEDFDHGCPLYVPSAIDLGVLGAMGFANGGGVSKTSGDDKLQIDGGKKSGKNTWYGGGYGDRPGNEYYNNTFCRGPIMRGDQTSPVIRNSEEYPVPKATTPTAFDAVDGTTHTAKKLWTSGRMSVGTDGSYSWTSSANLNIVWPTGAQWHTKGIALTLTEFEYNDSGILSYAEEKGESILLAPAPAYTVPTSEKAEEPASGLVVLADASETSRIQHGLRINDGRGLRIHGITKMKKAWPNAEEDDATVTAQKNKLEIHAFDNDLTFQTDGRLVFNDKATTSQHQITKLITSEVSEHPTTDLRASYRGGDWHEVTGENKGVGEEYTVPMLISYYKNSVATHRLKLYSVSESGKVMVNGDNIYNTFIQHKQFGDDAIDILEAVVVQLQSLFNTLGIAFQHVGKTGIILGTDQAETLPTTATRFATK